MARKAFGALVLVLALALAGCGGSTGSPAKPTNAIEAAALKTSQAGSVRTDFSISSSGGVSGTGSGVFNSGKDRSGQLTMNVTANGRQVAIDTVIVGNTIYVRSPLISQRLPSGKQWVKVDLKQAAKAANVDLSSLLSANPTPAAIRRSCSTSRSGSIDATTTPASAIATPAPWRPDGRSP